MFTGTSICSRESVIEFLKEKLNNEDHIKYLKGFIQNDETG